MRNIDEREQGIVSLRKDGIEEESEGGRGDIVKDNVRLEKGNRTEYNNENTTQEE